MFMGFLRVDYLSQSVVNALNKVNCNVYSTHKNRGNYLHNQIENRIDYHSAEKI